MSNQSPFAKLAAINVNDHVEKKNGLSYLSWAWAVAKLMENDPSANWEFHEPKMFGESMMVSCTVTAFGKPVTMHLPVMNHKNQAIKNPDAFEINKNMMRCLVKAIACHGLGLYIYAGEDLPEEDKEKAEQAAALAQRKAIDQYGETLRKCRHLGELADSWREIPQEVRTYLVGIKDEMKQEFEANERKAA